MISTGCGYSPTHTGRSAGSSVRIPVLAPCRCRSLERAVGAPVNGDDEGEQDKHTPARAVAGNTGPLLGAWSLGGWRGGRRCVDSARALRATAERADAGRRPGVHAARGGSAAGRRRRRRSRPGREDLSGGVVAPGCRRGRVARGPRGQADPGAGGRVHRTPGAGVPPPAGSTRSSPSGRPTGTCSTAYSCPAD